MEGCWEKEFLTSIRSFVTRYLMTHEKHCAMRCVPCHASIDEILWSLNISCTVITSMYLESICSRLSFPGHWFISPFDLILLASGRVYPAVMWDYYNNGSSIRMINPQYFSNTVWRLCATLQVGLRFNYWSLRRVSALLWKGYNRVPLPLVSSLLSWVEKIFLLIYLGQARLQYLIQVRMQG